MKKNNNTPIVFNKYGRFLAYLVIVIFLLFIYGIYIYYKQNIVKVASVPQNLSTRAPHQPTYKKIEYSKTTPPNFLKDLPLPSGVSFDQSYGLQYASQTQLTIVFSSPQTVEENFTLYKDFLRKQSWWFSDKDKFESKKLSSVYAHNMNQEINITVSEIALKGTPTSTPPMKSQVSISLLKR